jgi:superfamily II DNA or RNA helicase
VNVTSPKELIQLGHLVPQKYYGAKHAIDSSTGVGMMAGDFNKKDLFAKSDKKIIYDGVVGNYEKWGNNDRALVFCVNVEGSKKTTKAFTDAGISAAHIDGDTHWKERITILDNFARGRIKVLCNCQLLCEGYDLPDIRCIILNTDTQSRTLVMQMIGRALRPLPGKSHAVIIDHGSNIIRHGYAYHDYDYDIFRDDTPRKGKEKGDPMIRECPECYALIPAQCAECPECEYALREEKEEELVKSEFQELTQLDFIDVKKVPDHLNKPRKQMSDGEVREYGKFMGYKPGWAWMQIQLRKGFRKYA